MEGSAARGLQVYHGTVPKHSDTFTPTQLQSAVVDMSIGSCAATVPRLSLSARIRGSREGS